MHRFGCVLACALASNTVLAAPGDLDPSFSQSGIVRVVLPATTTLRAAALQSDGKIVVVGMHDGPAVLDDDVLVVRLNADGSPDSTFDSDGIAHIDFGGSDGAEAVFIASDGKILIGGRSYRTGGLINPAAARLNANGALDTTFGVAGVASYSVGRNMSIGALAELPDGRYVLGGTAAGDFAFMRVDANGSLDTAFGTLGLTFVNIDQGDDELADMRLRADGRLIAAGTSSHGPNHAIGVVALNNLGQPDPTFALGGTSFNVGNAETVRALELQADGKLLIAGVSSGASVEPLGMVVRLNADGTLDQSFGSQGRVVRADEISAVTIDPAGRIYFAGDLLTESPMFTRRRGYVQALDRDGSSAAAFASGRALIDAGHDAVLSNFTTVSMLRAGDGRLVVVGSGASSELLVARLATAAGHAGVISVLPTASSSDAYGSYTLAESHPSATFTVERTGGSQGMVTVDYAARSQQATQGVDFVATSGTLTWGDGETAAKIVTLPLIDDTDYEPAAEDIALVLSNPTGGAALATSSSSVQVTSDELTTYVAALGAEVIESAGTMTVLVERGGDARVPATVEYTVTGMSATPNIDFTPVSGVLSWPSFDTAPKVITIPILDDASPENLTEELRVQLSNPGPGTAISFGAASWTIVDDDGPAGSYLRFLQSRVVVNEAAGSLTLTVVRPSGVTTGNPLTCDVVIDDPAGAGASGSDHGPPNVTQLSWAANDTTSRTITIPIVDDQLGEGAEHFTVRLINGSGGNYAFGSFTIMDDDAPAGVGSQLSLSQAQLNVVEDAGAVTLMVARSGDARFPVSAEFSAAALTPGLTADYSFSGSNTLTWAAGDTSPKPITFTLVDDAVSESPESFRIYLRNLVGGATLGPIPQTVVTIQDNEPVTGTVGFAQDSITVSEDARFVDLLLTTTLTGSQADFAEFTFAVRAGSTADAGSEFVVERKLPRMGVIPGLGFRIYLNGDAQLEGDETFTVDLVQEFGTLPIERGSITVTLTSDDVTLPPAPTQLGFVTTAVSQQEGQLNVTVAVRRTGSADNAVAVSYETVAGTAVAGEDFVMASGQLHWAAGDMEDKRIVLVLANDATVESNETLTLRLLAPTNDATLADALATITVVDDDVAPPGSGGNGGKAGSGGGGGSFDLDTLLVLLLTLGLLARRRQRLGSTCRAYCLRYVDGAICSCLADRLDPESSSVIVDALDHHLRRGQNMPMALVGSRRPNFE